jgi:3-methyladenine DNA glycosylase AlkD
MPNTFVSFIKQEFAAKANEKKAGEMAAYMKTQMPFYGVSAPDRDVVIKEAMKIHPLKTEEEIEQAARELWSMKQREGKYAALRVAHSKKKFVSPQKLPLYETLIREGAWWDLVDEAAVRLVGAAHLKEPKKMAITLDKWIEDEDMWVRRTAIICQIKHKDKTDEARLFRYCLKCADESDFFIRKAIGWALREYGKTAPESVRTFVEANQDKLSPLSYKEATKRLK